MTQKTKVLILGGGFGGVYTALELEKRLGKESDVEITLVNRDNFFLFTPMLHGSQPAISTSRPSSTRSANS